MRDCPGLNPEFFFAYVILNQDSVTTVIKCVLHNTMGKRLRHVEQSVIGYVLNNVQLPPSAQGVFLFQFTLKLKR